MCRKITICVTNSVVKENVHRIKVYNILIDFESKIIPIISKSIKH